MKKLLTFFSILFVSILLVSCGDNEYTATFDLNYENAPAAETIKVVAGKKVEKPTDPTRDNYEFIAWLLVGEKYDFNKAVNENLTLKASWELKKYTVKFVDYDDTELKLETVEHGSAATAPDNPNNKENHYFDSWDVAFTNITKNLTIKALYKIDEYTVKFVDYNDEELETQSVKHGSAAIAPDNPNNKENYHFDKWNLAFDNITKDLTVKALYKINEYTVKFVDYDDAELKTQTIEHGSAATAPDSPDNKVGYHFDKWDLAFDNITKDLTVKALYKINEYTVKFVDYDDTELKTQIVEHGSAATAPDSPDNKVGYHFDKWELDFDNIIEDLTIKALYKINQYAVEFIVDGEKFAEEIVDHGSKVDEPDEPTKDYYKLVGWFLGDNEYSFESEVIGNLTLVAKWERTHYVVSFDLGYQTEETLPNQVIKVGENALRPKEDPIRNRYEFINWVESDLETIFVFEQAINEDTTIYAKWEQLRVLIDFDLGFDAVGPEEQNIIIGERATRPEEDPIRDRYEFVNWVKSDLETIFDFEQTINKDTTIYAKWNQLEVIVSFEVGEGSPKPDQQRFDVGQNAVKPEIDPTREGYNFIGWFIEGEEEAYEFETAIIKDTLLTAKWQIITFSVTFDVAGGTLQPETQTVDYGSTAAKPLDPELEGHNFLGWFIENEEEAFEFETAIIKNTSLTAKWQIITYAVTFDVAGGTPQIETQIVDYGTEATRPENPTKENYRFLGWYLATEEYDFELVVTKNLVLVAEWQSLTPEIEGELYHWMPNSPKANITADIDFHGAEQISVVMNGYPLIENEDYMIIGEKFGLAGAFLVEHSNEIGQYQVEITTEYGEALFKYYVVDNPADTSIPTKEITVPNMGLLAKATITEPITGVPELLITEVSADSGKYSYIEVFNNSSEVKNLKGHIIVFGNLTKSANLASLLEDGLIAEPMGAVPFYIYEDCLMEPFETVIIWYLSPGNRKPWDHGNYDQLAVTDENYLFDWQGGTLTFDEFRRVQNIEEDKKIVVVRNNAYVINNATGHDENGFGTPVWRGGAFTSQNSSVANRAVQIMYFDPEKVYAADIDAPEGATYFKIETGIHNTDKDLYEDGVINLANFIDVGTQKNRYNINTFYMRRVYYNDEDERVGYDNKWNLANDQAVGVWHQATYRAVAKEAIQVTALFYPPVDGSTEIGRWGLGIGLEYMIPEAGSHIMRFMPRNPNADYEGFVGGKYTHPITNTLYSQGFAEYSEELYAEVTQTLIVPVSSDYYYPAYKENSAGVVSKYNLGLE